MKCFIRIPVFRDTLRARPLNHPGRDSRDAVEREGDESFDPECSIVDRTLGWKQAELEGCVDFEVLHVKPTDGSCAPGDEESQRSAKEGGFYGENDVRLPEGFAEHDGEASEHEGNQMHDSLEACGLLGNVKRRSIDGGLPRRVLGSIPVTTIVVPDSPGWIIGRGSDHSDLVALLREPSSHLACIFANSRKLGSVVQTVDQNSQMLPFVGSCSAVLIPYDKQGR